MLGLLLEDRIGASWERGQVVLVQRITVHVGDEDLRSLGDGLEGCSYDLREGRELVGHLVSFSTVTWIGDELGDRARPDPGQVLGISRTLNLEMSNVERN